MCAIGATRAVRVLESAVSVCAIELLSASQGVDLRQCVKQLPVRLRLLYERVRARVPHMVHDRVIGDDVNQLIDLLKTDDMFSTNSTPIAKL